MSLLATGRLRAAQQNNLAAGKDPTADEAQQGWLDKLRTLVPTDAVTAYVALIGATSALAVGWRIAALALIAVLAPVRVVLSYLSKADDAAQKEVRVPIFDATVGLLAFLAWSTTIPKSPWDQIDGFTPAIGLVITLFASILLGAAQEAHKLWLKRNMKPTPSEPAPV
jgi:hypothetical protein